MIPTFSKPRVLSKSQIDEAVEFHGHSGLLLLLGLRMGQLALRLLNAKGYFDISCVIELSKWSPPDSCIIDGIQFSTGCTMGKHNIEIIEGKDGIATTFTKEGKPLRIELRSSFLNAVRKALEEKDEEKLKQQIIDAVDMDIFEVRRT